MAEATKHDTPYTVTLELSQEEAEAVEALLGIGHAGGPTEPVWSALTDAGVRGRYNACSRSGEQIYYVRLEKK